MEVYELSINELFYVLSCQFVWRFIVPREQILINSVVKKLSISLKEINHMLNCCYPCCGLRTRLNIRKHFLLRTLIFFFKYYVVLKLQQIWRRLFVSVCNVFPLPILCLNRWVTSEDWSQMTHHLKQTRTSADLTPAEDFVFPKSLNVFWTPEMTQGRQGLQ